MIIVSPGYTFVGSTIKEILGSSIFSTNSITFEPPLIIVSTGNEPSTVLFQVTGSFNSPLIVILHLSIPKHSPFGE